MNDTIYLLFLLFIIYIYLTINKDESIYVYNDNDNIMIVRNLDDKQVAIDTIKKLRFDIINLIDNIIIEEDIQQNEFYNYIYLIKNRITSMKMNEADAKNKHTSYTINKGDEMVVCLRSKKNQAIHEYNELLYVVIHEVAHIGCPEIGHTKLFKKINQFLLNKAIQYELYRYINYEEEPMEYCGIELNTNVIKQ